VFVCVVGWSNGSTGLPFTCHSAAAKTHHWDPYQNDNQHFLFDSGCSWWFHVGCVVRKILRSN
jgi:hypothetical protein